jgi:hypothetical protein
MGLETHLQIGVGGGTGGGYSWRCEIGIYLLELDHYYGVGGHLRDLATVHNGSWPSSIMGAGYG